MNKENDFLFNLLLIKIRLVNPLLYDRLYILDLYTHSSMIRYTCVLRIVEEWVYKSNFN